MDFSFLHDAKDLGEIPTGSPQWGLQIEVGVGFGSAIVDQYHAIFQKHCLN